MSEEIRKGLVGVIADETAVSKVMPETNSLTYRGYAVQDLAAHCSFEQVAYLLWNGELPSEAQLEDFCAQERHQRELSDEAIAVIAKFPTYAHPMDTVRAGITYIGMEDKDAWDLSPGDIARKSMSLLAKIPTVMATDYRFRKGHARIAPRPDLTISENFFHMCFGEVPEPDIVRCFDISMILYAEHSFNASTFTARTITSSLSDVYSAVAGAIGSLKGPLHGGANEAVMEMLLEIGSPDRAQAWIDDALANKRLVMGFGHRVYKHGDSRVPTMTEALEKVAALRDGQNWLDIEKIVADTVDREKGIKPNLDYPAGPAYYLMGFDIDMFTPIFVMSRITGWCAHIMEQLADNKLIRPLSTYTGPAQRAVKG